MKAAWLSALALSLILAATAIEFLAAPHVLYINSPWLRAWWVRVLVASVLPLSVLGLAIFILARALWRNPVFDQQRKQRWGLIFGCVSLTALLVTVGLNLAWPQVAQSEADRFLQFISEMEQRGMHIDPTSGVWRCANDLQSCVLGQSPLWMQAAVLSPPWAVWLIVLGYLLRVAVLWLFRHLRIWRHSSPAPP